MVIEVNDKLVKRVRAYCEENGLDMGSFTERLIMEGLGREMYGENPFDNINRETGRVVVTEPDKSVIVEKTDASIKVDTVAVGEKHDQQIAKKEKKVRVIKTISTK